MKTKRGFFVVVLFCILSSLVAQDLYWDIPRTISQSNVESCFPSVVSTDSCTTVFWQEIDIAKKQIWLSCKKYYADGSDHTYSRFSGPFSYSGEVPDIYSVTARDDGSLYIAVLSDITTITIIRSADTQSFIPCYTFMQESPLVAPRIYTLSDDTLLLFTSLGYNETFSILSASSKNGTQWTDFTQFKPTIGMSNVFLPVVGKSKSGDCVVFQAQYLKNNRYSYQLFISKLISLDNWAAPQLLSSAYTNYDNQQPYLYSFDDKLYMTWERSELSSADPQICVGVISDDAAVLGEVTEVTSLGAASKPILFDYHNILSLTWCDTRTGISTAYYAQKNGATWIDQAISPSATEVFFVSPVKSPNSKELQFFWQLSASKKSTYTAIQRLSLDSSATPPRLEGVHFTDGAVGKASKLAVNVHFSEDAAGIAGYSWIWTKDSTAEPERKIQSTVDGSQVSLSADTDGVWYFKSRTMDYAGNWSDVATITYVRDTVPPAAPDIQPLQTDSNGFSVSNSPYISWAVPDNEAIKGYTWSFILKENLDPSFVSYKNHAVKASRDSIEQLLSNARTIAETAEVAVPQRLMGTIPRNTFKDMHNGIYVFAVAAIDKAGNIGIPVTIPVVLNKYEPHIVLHTIQSKVSNFGERFFDILGDGFTYDGDILTVYIDADGHAPYDIALSLKDKAYTVASNTLIKQVKIPDSVMEGAYFVGVAHSRFGNHFTAKPLLTVSNTGTVKFGNDTFDSIRWLSNQVDDVFELQFSHIAIALFLLFLFFGCGGCIYGLVSTARDASHIQTVVTTLLEGGSMQKEQKTLLSVSYKKKRTSLKLKLMSFTILLVLMIVMLIAVPLQMIMISTQEKVLTAGLKNRVDVLLNGMAIGGRSYLPDRNIFELSFLPSQTEVLEDAHYATITGFDADNKSISLTHVWATNDADIQTKIDTDTLILGQSQIQDETVALIAQQCMDLNKIAEEQLTTVSAEIAELTAESQLLYRKTDEASQARLVEIQRVATALNEKVSSVLGTIAEEGTSAYPAFNTDRLDKNNTEYLFYRPIMYRQLNSQTYVHGIVLIQVTTENLIHQVRNEQKTLLITTFIIALFAVVIGIIGSLIVATIIVRPIRKLVAHVAMIGETRDKEKLIGKDIVVTSHDEIGELGETVNEMTHGLIKAAQEEHLLIDGKVVQQTFLPLNVAGNGAKETTSKFKDTNIECFGYYEGASSVSGDYYDYKKLDSRWFVTIKCDVSGHGVPAALIMTVVATLFRKYFENWTFAKNGIRINELVVQINDFIESLGLKGKFATIILCLLDMESGTVYACNAGDNIVHVYDKAQHKIHTIHLTETPAAGPLPSFMVELKGGFKVEKIHLNRGDVLFLYTDGIEESTRKFRNSNCEIIPCAEPGLAENAVHENHKVGQTSEQLEPERIRNIIEAVFAKKTYTLKKYHCPNENETLLFDFTHCDGTIEEAILALISVEKVFRLYKDPFATDIDSVRVDKKIDAFLQKHFNLYDVYCNEKEIPSDGSYVFYKNCKEDEQLDDLTLVALCRSINV
ncbi:MAG: SpoIIE family protein phosphatase [Treponema sp.]|nr:SpoIIE family protein phosphatase [Treponema sp.]